VKFDKSICFNDFYLEVDCLLSIIIILELGELLFTFVIGDNLGGVLCDIC
jgi:hypothetical protein